MNGNVDTAGFEDAILRPVGANDRAIRVTGDKSHRTIAGVGTPGRKKVATARHAGEDDADRVRAN